MVEKKLFDGLPEQPDDSAFNEIQTHIEEGPDLIGMVVSTGRVLGQRLADIYGILVDAPQEYFGGKMPRKWNF